MQKFTMRMLRDMENETRKREQFEMESMHDFLWQSGLDPFKGEYMGGVEDKQPYLSWWVTTNHGDRPVKISWMIGGFVIKFADDFSERHMDFFPGIEEVAEIVTQMIRRYNTTE